MFFSFLSSRFVPFCDGFKLEISREQNKIMGFFIVIGATVVVVAGWHDD